MPALWLGPGWQHPQLWISEECGLWSCGLDGRKPSQAERREDGTALGRLEIFRSCVRQQRSVSEARSRHCRAEFPRSCPRCHLVV